MRTRPPGRSSTSQACSTRDRHQAPARPRAGLAPAGRRGVRAGRRPRVGAARRGAPGGRRPLRRGAGRTPVTCAEDLPIVRRYWRSVFGKQLAGRAAVTVPNLYAVASVVTAGAGYSVLPRSLCQDHLASGALVLLHDPDEPPLNTLFLVQRPGADANPDVVRVRDRLRSAARTW
ncbi:LysR substrate-binding domain-containing protein [Streptomyces sp. NPDC002896]|uniref:LysR substrate-binding domain-containing protein n=1 Tax=Streptomyces sp. NPDC002896 TaxID=3154438 RepID=UPI00333284FF